MYGFVRFCTLLYALVLLLQSTMYGFVRFCAGSGFRMYGFVRFRVGLGGTISYAFVQEGVSPKPFRFGVLSTPHLTVLKNKLPNVPCTPKLLWVGCRLLANIGQGSCPAFSALLAALQQIQFELSCPDIDLHQQDDGFLPQNTQPVQNRTFPYVVVIYQSSVPVRKPYKTVHRFVHTNYGSRSTS